MRATLASALLTATALLITGCGGPGEPAAAEPSVTAAASEEKASLDDTCMELFGYTTLAVDSAKFLSEVSALNADTAKQASSIGTRLGAVAATAQPELAEPLQIMQTEFQDFAQAWEDSGEWILNLEAYRPAKDEVSAICTPRINALASGAATPTPDPALTAEEATPAPAPSLTAEEKFLAGVRAEHPAMKSTDTANMVTVAKNFCLIYDTATANGKADLAPPTVKDMITAAAGIEYTLAELHTIHETGVTIFCPQHTDKLA
ncbi:hypothetical protein ACIP9X_20280 [Arthrobacter sp. NPDC093125]|uniref:hypothetical protein n=1 Tax=Arthrobacter sp. NPDC093125 TaxID=3363944 RepID=UPI0038161249